MESDFNMKDAQYHLRDKEVKVTVITTEGETRMRMEAERRMRMEAERAAAMEEA